MTETPAQDLYRDIEDLIARRDITDCVCRYMRGQDRLDPELQKSAFHSDAWIDCGPLAGGVDQFVAYAQNGLAGCAFTHHMIGQIHLNIGRETAAGEIYFIAYHRIEIDGQMQDMIFGGRYIDKYAKRNGVWAIESRTEIADWTRTEPAADRFFEIEPEYRRGIRDYSELSYQNWTSII